MRPFHPHILAPHIVALACLAAVPAAGLRAQSPADRAALEALRDSLLSSRDSVPLLSLEKRMIAQAKNDRGNVVLHLRLGFVSLRLGEIAGHSHYDDAASEFQWAIDLQPQWPYAWYGMGLAEYGVGDSQVSIVAGLATMLGKDALSRSAMAFAKSAEVDPSFGRGLVELANTALRQRVNIKLGVALDALRRSASTAASENPDVLLARGRIERETGDVDSALVAFRHYLKLGQDSALALLELGRTELIAGRPGGETHYYEGAGRDDSTAVAEYRKDIAVIAPDSSLDAFDATHGAARAAFLHDFWDTRDDADLQPRGARLTEHYRRLAYARRNFFLTSLSRHYDIVERYRSGSRDYDDRGIIYIRQGKPTDRASYHSPTVEANESWRYARSDGDLIFHFIAREDVQDYKLVESLFDILGFSTAVNAQNSDSTALNARVQDLLLSREQLSPIYGRLQRVGAASEVRFQNDERRVGRESIRRGTTTDSYELEFAKSLIARAEVLGVGHDSGSSLLQVTYAIPGTSLDPVQIERGSLYVIRLRVAVFDSTGHLVATLDTTRRVVSARPVPPNENLVGRVALRVPAGTLQYRMAIQSGADVGTVLPRDTVRVIPPTAGTPMLSDLVLGSRRVPAVWHPAPGDTVFFNPLRTFKTGEEMQLYYEMTGVSPGADYTTQVAVKRGKGGGGFLRKLFGGGGSALSIKFQEHATSPTAAVTRTLSLAKLKPGEYTLEVTITDAAGRSDRRAEGFEVVQ
jgi:GWxTD domain-containing protein